MNAIKNYMATIAESKNRTSMLLNAWREISDRLDALEAKAHEHNAPVSVVSQSPTSDLMDLPGGTLYTHYDTTEQEQGGDDEHDDTMDDGEITDGIIMDGKLYYAEKVVDDLRARLEQAEAMVGELAIRRGKEIERLEAENAELKRIAGIAIENWESWAHDQLDGTLGLKDAIYEVDELKRQLDKSEVKR